MPVAEIVYLAAACFEGSFDFRDLPLVVWHEAMAPVKSAGAGTTQLDNDMVPFRTPSQKDASILKGQRSRAYSLKVCITCQESQTVIVRLRSIWGGRR
ncbi:hypothetical protein AOQ72_04340 [Bradyrhizobium yuanmingense]|uniref:Uncharacterized protein n=1 Tax=Bradyrhizobium yuanmingense TaxID=108015 RepID=A0A0R3BSX4_9BRAD|nr:hypothetical protein AOQ72_04340 [Bradyrhizobium yuanmingense]